MIQKELNQQVMLLSRLCCVVKHLLPATLHILTHAYGEVDFLALNIHWNVSYKLGRP